MRESMVKDIVIPSSPSPLNHSDPSISESPTGIALPPGGIHHRSSTAAFQHTYDDPAPPSPIILSPHPTLSEGLEKEVNPGILLTPTSIPRNATSPLPFSDLRGSLPQSRKQSVTIIRGEGGGGGGAEEKTLFPFSEIPFRSALRKGSNAVPDDVSRAGIEPSTSPRRSRDPPTHLSVPFAKRVSYARVEGGETPLLPPPSLTVIRLEKGKESVSTRVGGNNLAQGIYSTSPRQHERGETKAAPSPVSFSSSSSPISHSSGISGSVLLRRASSCVMSEGTPSPRENALSLSTIMASEGVRKGRSKSSGEGKNMEGSMNQGEDTVLLVMAGNPRPSHFNAVHTARKAYRDLEDDHVMLWGELTTLKQRNKRIKNIALYSLLPAMVQLKTEWIHTKSSVRNALNTFWGYFSTYHDLLRRAVMQHIMEDDFDADGEEEGDDDDGNDSDEGGGGTSSSSSTWHKRQFSPRIYARFPTWELLPQDSFKKKEILHQKNTEENRAGGRDGGTRRKMDALSRERRPLSFIFTPPSYPFESHYTKWREGMLQEEEEDEEETTSQPQRRQQKQKKAITSNGGKSTVHSGFSAFPLENSASSDPRHSVEEEENGGTNNDDDRGRNQSGMEEGKGGKKNEKGGDKDGDQDEEEEEDGSFLPCLSVTSVPTTRRISGTGTDTTREHSESIIEDETQRRVKQKREQVQCLVGECPNENWNDNEAVESLSRDFFHPSSASLLSSPPSPPPFTAPIHTTSDSNKNNMATTSTEERETQVSSPSESSCTLFSSSSTRDLEQDQRGEGRSNTSFSRRINKEEMGEGKEEQEDVLSGQEEVLKVPALEYRALENQLAAAQRAVVELSQKREYDKEIFQTRMNQMHRVYILREQRMMEEIRLYHAAMESIKRGGAGLTEEKERTRNNEEIHQIQCCSMHEHGGISSLTPPLSLPENEEKDIVKASLLETEIGPDKVEKVWKNSEAVTEEVVKDTGVMEENTPHSAPAVPGTSPQSTMATSSSTSSGGSSRASTRIMPERSSVPSDPSPSCSSPSVLPWWKRDELWKKAVAQTKRQEKKEGGVLHAAVRRDHSPASLSSSCTSLEKAEGWTSKYQEQEGERTRRRPNTTMRTTTLLQPDYYSQRCETFFTNAVERLGIHLEKEQKRKQDDTRRNRREEEEKAKSWRGGEDRRLLPNTTRISFEDPSLNRGSRRNASAPLINNSKKQEEEERKPLPEWAREIPSAIVMERDKTHYVIAQGMWAEQLLLERACRRSTAAR